jgi:hypothetical protein
MERHIDTEPDDIAFDDGTIGYEPDTLLRITDRPESFHHVDRSRLHRVAPPARNQAAGTG